ncbi:hypothetical protein BDV3_003522 [Batrachochytrium dendrobatidis]|uniref:C2H2-type domain-containing protein n=1 Tax=Batrachochytrium dendrobatidis (strain JEL423) TaxID=403673 RepID=A0A177WCT2_BATDL|nr:hypothetical protein BDEG_21889 [Batrachochytrium dendrobatidis JEL423]
MPRQDGNLIKDTFVSVSNESMTLHPSSPSHPTHLWTEPKQQEIENSHGNDNQTLQSSLPISVLSCSGVELGVSRSISNFHMDATHVWHNNRTDIPSVQHKQVQADQPINKQMSKSASQDKFRHWHVVFNAQLPLDDGSVLACKKQELEKQSKIKSTKETHGTESTSFCHCREIFPCSPKPTSKINTIASKRQRLEDREAPVEIPARHDDQCREDGEHDADRPVALKSLHLAAGGICDDGIARAAEPTTTNGLQALEVDDSHELDDTVAATLGDSVNSTKTAAEEQLPRVSAVNMSPTRSLPHTAHNHPSQQQKPLLGLEGSFSVDGALVKPLETSAQESYYPAHTSTAATMDNKQCTDGSIAAVTTNSCILNSHKSIGINGSESPHENRHLQLDAAESDAVYSLTLMQVTCLTQSSPRPSRSTLTASTSVPISSVLAKPINTSTCIKSVSDVAFHPDHSSCIPSKPSTSFWTPGLNTDSIVDSPVQYSQDIHTLSTPTVGFIHNRSKSVTTPSSSHLERNCYSTPLQSNLLTPSSMMSADESKSHPQHFSHESMLDKQSNSTFTRSQTPLTAALMQQQLKGSTYRKSFTKGTGFNYSLMNSTDTPVGSAFSTGVSALLPPIPTSDLYTSRSSMDPGFKPSGMDAYNLTSYSTMSGQSSDTAYDQGMSAMAHHQHTAYQPLSHQHARQQNYHCDGRTSIEELDPKHPDYHQHKPRLASHTSQLPCSYSDDNPYRFTTPVSHLSLHHQTYPTTPLSSGSTVMTHELDYGGVISSDFSFQSDSHDPVMAHLVPQRVQHLPRPELFYNAHEGSSEIHQSAQLHAQPLFASLPFSHFATSAYRSTMDCIDQDPQPFYPESSHSSRDGLSVSDTTPALSVATSPPEPVGFGTHKYIRSHLSTNSTSPITSNSSPANFSKATLNSSNSNALQVNSDEGVGSKRAKPKRKTCKKQTVSNRSNSVGDITQTSQKGSEWNSHLPLLPKQQSASTPTNHTLSIPHGAPGRPFIPPTDFDEDSSRKLPTCPVCGQSFTRAFNLNSHLKSHENVKPFACELCCMSFTRRHDLNRHMRQHMPERPFVCGRCSRTFLRKDALKRHERMHDSHERSEAKQMPIN